MATEGEMQQEPVGRDNVAGGGEFPSPHTSPSGPAPGTVPGEAERIEAEREERTGASGSAPSSES
jgi:hypothetical protein